MSSDQATRRIGVLLAAGCSRRMGETKQLLMWPAKDGERPLVAAAFDAIRPICDDMVVVVGHEAECVVAALADRRFYRAQGYPDAPMFESIRAGIAAAINLDAYGTIVLQPGDHPEADQATLRDLNNWSLKRPVQAIIPEYGGRGGHPVFIPPIIAARLLKADCPGGLGQFWNDHLDLCHRVPIEDAGVIRDIDTPARFSPIEWLRRHLQLLPGHWLEWLVPTYSPALTSLNQSLFAIMSTTPSKPATAYERPPYMATLGLLPPYTAEDVEKGYLAKIKEIRPDLGGDREAFYAVQQAYVEAREYVKFRGDRRGWIAKRMDDYLAVQEVITRLQEFGAQVQTDAVDWLQKSFGDFAELTESVSSISLHDALNGDEFIEYIVSQHQRLLELAPARSDGVRCIRHIGPPTERVPPANRVGIKPHADHVGSAARHRVVAGVGHGGHRGHRP